MDSYLCSDVVICLIKLFCRCINFLLYRIGQSYGFSWDENATYDKKFVAGALLKFFRQVLYGHMRRLRRSSQLSRRSTLWFGENFCPIWLSQKCQSAQRSCIKINYLSALSAEKSLKHLITLRHSSLFDLRLASIVLCTTCSTFYN